MRELLHLLANQLIFFLDPHGYSIIGSGGSATGNAFIDMRRGELIWRLARAKAQITLELRFRENRDYPAYSTDILKRWLSGERDDEAALLTDEVAAWVRDRLAEIERALDERREETIAEWDSLKRRRAKELFG